MVLTIEQTRKKPRINYALAATLIATGISMADAAKQVGAKNANSLAVGLNRKGVNAKLARSHHVTEGQTRTLTLRVANAAGEALREQFADILTKHGAALAKVPAKRNLAHIRKVGDAFEPLARVAKIVHDWGNTQTVGLVALRSVNQVEQAEQPAIECKTTQEACVSDPAKVPENGS